MKKENTKQIMKEIRTQREGINEMLEQGHSLLNPNIYKKSLQLDRLIEEYYELKEEQTKL